MTLYPRYSILVSMMLLQAFLAQAQFYDSGRSPYFLKWSNLETPHFRIIFPQENTAEARKLALMLEESLPHLQWRTGKALRNKIPIVIHGRSALSNALFSLAPRRLEVYPLSPQSSYSQEWLAQLAVHELRHAVQLDYLNQGMLRGLSFLFGQQIIALATGLYIPSWFLEGDAVMAETAFSPSGRGRVPGFQMELKAQLLHREIYSYDKAVFGSYRDHVADKYILGYHLVTASNLQHGTRLWQEAARATAMNPLIPNPFNRKLKQISGRGFSKLYQEVMDSLQRSWAAQSGSVKPDSFNRLVTTASNLYKDYQFPREIDPGHVLVYRHGLEDIPRFVSLDSAGGEAVLFTPGNVVPDQLSYSQGLICWTELIPDPFWENRSFSVIKIHDTRTGETRTLGKKSRRYAASLSPDATRLLAVDQDSAQPALLVIGLPGEEVLHRITCKDGCNFIRPSWHPTENKIIVVLHGSKGKALAEIETVSGNIRQITDFEFYEIDYPCYWKEKIIFTASYEETSHLYSLDTLTGALNLLFRSAHGASEPSARANGKLLLADYTAEGYRPIEIDSPPKNRPVEKKAFSLANKVVEALGVKPIPFSKEYTDYKILTYHKWKHLFQFHSWAPLFIDIDHTGIYPGASIFSQNLLNTLFLSAGYQYNRYEESGRWIGKLSYKGWYPSLDFSISDGRRKAYYVKEQLRHPFSYREQEFVAGASLPLNLSRNKYYRGIRPSASLVVTKLSPLAATPSFIHLPDMQSLLYQITVYQLLKYQARDLGPAFGQVVQFQYRHSLPGEPDHSSLLGIRPDFYFPGLFKHHSIKLSFGFQCREAAKTYRFSDFLLYPSGFHDLSERKSGTFSFSYAMPLAYPDRSLPGIVYLKRISTTLFTESFTNFSRDNANSPYYNAGADLNFDLHLLRFYAPLKIGARGYYNIRGQSFHSELLFSTNLSAY